MFPLQAADAAQKLSTGLFQGLFFKELDPQTDPRCTADAVIYAIKDDGVLVFVPESVSQRSRVPGDPDPDPDLPALVPSVDGMLLENLLGGTS